MLPGDFTTKAISDWMNTRGPRSDIVLSSRVRLARNLMDLPFPAGASNTQAEAVYKSLQKVCTEDQEANKALGHFEFMRMKELEELDKRVLVEKHLISPGLAEGATYGALLLNKEESIS
ncbi:MAG: modulator of CtsR repression, McsB, partial [Bacillota bacterium]